MVEISILRACGIKKAACICPPPAVLQVHLYYLFLEQPSIFSLISVSCILQGTLERLFDWKLIEH